MGCISGKNKVYEASVTASLIHGNTKDINQEYILETKSVYYKPPLRVTKVCVACQRLARVYSVGQRTAGNGDEEDTKM